MEQIVVILLVLVLATQTGTIALGLATSHKIMRWTIDIVIIAGIQVLSLFLGMWLGNYFMYLLNGIHKTILFAGFFLIAIRFILNTFKIKNGERTWQLISISDLIAPSVAQAINTFLAGILLYFVNFDLNNALIEIFLFALFFCSIFVFLPVKKRAFTLLTLINLLSGFVLILISFYFVFF